MAQARFNVIGETQTNLKISECHYLQQVSISNALLWDEMNIIHSQNFYSSSERGRYNTEKTYT